MARAIKSLIMAEPMNPDAPVTKLASTYIRDVGAEVNACSTALR